MKVERRKVLQTLGGISLGCLIPYPAKTDWENLRKVNHMKDLVEADVVVVGGGTAGVIAAIQAGREGSSIILVENGSQLGGTMTTGGVSFPGLFHAWGKQIIRGIGWELVTETVDMDDGKLPDFSIPTGKNHPRHQIRINPGLYVLLAEEKCLEAGVKLRYYETPVSVEFKGDRWIVDTIGKGSYTRIICKQLIDCTGNGEVASLAGYRLIREGETQPGTQMFRIEGYDPDSVDLDMLHQKFIQEVANGKMLYSDARGNIVSLLRSGGDNAQHVINADSSTSALHTQTNINGRASILRLLKFLRSFPGCTRTRLVSIQPETGVRETFRIDGEYQISVGDYVTGRIFDDSLAYSFYPVDLHDSKGIVPKHLEEGTVATIPLRALIPKGSRNFLVAGRCVSSDRLANSALRVQASSMAMGQIAGATASLAAKTNKSPLDVPIQMIREVLLNNKAIVPNSSGQPGF